MPCRQNARTARAVFLRKREGSDAATRDAHPAAFASEYAESPSPALGVHTTARMEEHAPARAAAICAACHSTYAVIVVSGTVLYVMREAREVTRNQWALVNPV